MKQFLNINRLSILCQLSVSAALLLLAGTCMANARSSAGLDDQIFADRFAEDIDVLLPFINDEYQLPPYTLSAQLDWIIDELDASETTTLAEIQARFVPGFDQPGLVSFFNDNLRVNFPNARVIDLIGISPVRATFVIEGDNPNSDLGFVQLGVQYSGQELVTLFSVQPFFGSVQFPGDQNLTLTEAADRFQTLAASNSLFVGRINSDGQCESVISRSPDTARALGSIFKMWVIGTVGEHLNLGLSLPEDTINLVASELAAGGIINNEPLGTPFTVRDMAVMMMADSDNTSTDHLHELVGRSAIEQVVADYGIVETEQLLPFLNISEQFHVFSRFDLPTALSYVNGDLPFREQFLTNQIVPLGPSFPQSFPFFHESLLSTGTWSASATDICRTLAGMHALPRNSVGFEVVNQAMGYQAAQPNVRSEWQRVWYKGGGLSSGSTGQHVLTNAWLLQKDGESEPWVVVGLTNDSSGGIDIFEVNSVLSRILELVADLP
ncbi:MAG: serine hydrolase [Pseudomonadota bacterium]